MTLRRKRRSWLIALVVSVLSLTALTFVLIVESGSFGSKDNHYNKRAVFV